MSERMKCPVCWSEKGYNEGVRVRLAGDYSDSWWVCSDGCAEFVHSSDEYYMEFFHNFTDRMMTLKGVYATASHFMSFREWVKKSPRDEIKAPIPRHKTYVGTGFRLGGSGPFVLRRSIWCFKAEYWPLFPVVAVILLR